MSESSSRLVATDLEWCSFADSCQRCQACRLQVIRLMLRYTLHSNNVGQLFNSVSLRETSKFYMFLDWEVMLDSLLAFGDMLSAITASRGS